MISDDVIGKEVRDVLEHAEEMNLPPETLVLQQILELLSRSWGMNVVWIPRGGNGVVNWLLGKELIVHRQPSGWLIDLMQSWKQFC